MNHHRSNIIVGTGLLLAAAGCNQPGPRYNTALPGILLDQRNGRLIVEGKICTKRGILEYLAVTPNGKAYESLITLKCRPSDLRAGLLLTGFIPGNVAPSSRGDFAPGAEPMAKTLPEGVPQVTQPPPEYWETESGRPTVLQIDVLVRQADSSWNRSSVERFLLSRETWESPPRLNWAFTGSFFDRDETTGHEFFAADVEKSLIALWYDPTALLNLSDNLGNPYRGKSSGLEVHGLHVPPVGTEVRLVFLRVD